MLAFTVAKRNHISNSFNRKSVMASKKRLYGLMRRHQELFLRRSKASLLRGVSGFYKGRFSELFDVMLKVVDENKLDVT
jgi:hypothetical protein